MKYQVEIVETLSRIVDVDAISDEDAEQKVHQMYRSGEIVLGGDDCLDTEIEVVRCE